MKILNLKGVNFFILCIWMEIIIFSLSLVSGNLLSNLLFYASRLALEKDFYAMSRNVSDGVRLSLMFAAATLFQHLFTSFLARHIKNRLNLMLYLVNACAVSCFFMHSLLARTSLKNYKLLWLGFFAALLIGVSELIISNRRFFLSPFGSGRKANNRV
ncbi:MAG: hypothetical protein COT17_07105 [Elusimicrobia bacterium CG08_land_8_20_14_0_20_51_18]|nr:MAG: hypothetical protein COT17_07105 [Elusimicrobia bacterium CG08_land_8_20_14_0_20_51_18]